MEKNYKFLVQKFERRRWVTKLETIDIYFAYEFAQDYAAKTLERVRVLRVDEVVLINFFYTR